MQIFDMNCCAGLISPANTSYAYYACALPAGALGSESNFYIGQFCEIGRVISNQSTLVNEIKGSSFQISLSHRC